IHWRRPSLQTYFPPQLPQASPIGGGGGSGRLSMTPSQSSSSPLQTSVTPVTTGASQTVLLPSALQTKWPVVWQRPMPRSHGMPRFAKPLSMTPSQSSSCPLQSSAFGPTSPLQVPKLPATQIWVPARQRPRQRKLKPFGDGSMSVQP